MNVLEIAAAANGPRIVVAVADNVLEVWDIATRTRVSRFESVYDLGERRLAIDATGTRVIAAAWARHGVACYDADTGAVVWRRKDVSSSQTVAFSNDGSLVHCGQDRKPFRVLDSASGADVATLRGVDNVWESPFDDFSVRAMRGSKPLSVVRQSDGVALGKFPQFHWTNDVAFAPGRIGVAYPSRYGSEDLATVRCYDATLEELWSYTSPTDAHVLRLTASPDRAGFLAVEFHTNDDDNPDRLLRLSLDTGRVDVVAETPRATDRVFVSGGRFLVMTTGQTIDCQLGTPLAPFPFE